MIKHLILERLGRDARKGLNSWDFALNEAFEAGRAAAGLPIAEAGACGCNCCDACKHAGGTVALLNNLKGRLANIRRAVEQLQKTPFFRSGQRRELLALILSASTKDSYFRG